MIRPLAESVRASHRFAHYLVASSTVAESANRENNVDGAREFTKDENKTPPLIPGCESTSGVGSLSPIATFFKHATRSSRRKSLRFRHSVSRDPTGFDKITR